jgi:hypothetical protein
MADTGGEIRSFQTTTHTNGRDYLSRHSPAISLSKGPITVATEIFVCEYCGTPDVFRHFIMNVFGSVYYFCSQPCQKAWVTERQRSFNDKPSSI